MAWRDQLTFIAAFYRDRSRIRIGAHLRGDPLCRLHLEPGRDDPYPIYEQVRARGPVSRSTFGVWVTADHATCHSVLRDRAFGATGEEAPATSPQLSFLEMNPPDHTRLRRLALPSFGPKAVADFEPMITETTAGLLDRVRPGEPFDLVETLASPLPIAVITRLLGVPDADAAEFARYGTTFGSALGGLQSIGHATELMRTQKHLDRMFRELLELRRREPGADVISRLAAADQTQLRAEEFSPLCTLLLIAGFETTVNLIGNTVLALLQQGSWARVAADPSLTRAAVEETLRWDSPVQRTARMALREVEIGGQRLAKGDMLVLLLGGANRDPAVFDRPAIFDLDRDPHEHLAFSGGIHYCVGAPLARLEATVAVRELVTRFPGLRLAGRRERRPGTLIRGLQRFEVQAAPSRRPTVATAG